MNGFKLKEGIFSKYMQYTTIIIKKPIEIVNCLLDLKVFNIVQENLVRKFNQTLYPHDESDCRKYYLQFETSSQGQILRRIFCV